METFKIEGEFVELIKLIKYLSWTESGGQAKLLVDTGEIFVNGIQEKRKRAKLTPGCVVKWKDLKIKLID